jgi:hypothetical protein
MNDRATEAVMLEPKLELIPCAAIAPSETRIQQLRRKRYDMESLKDLAASIGKLGVQQPGVVRKLPAMRGLAAYELVAGERRWRASRLADAHHFPAIIRELTDAEVLEIQLVENIQRETLLTIPRGTMNAPDAFLTLNLGEAEVRVPREAAVMAYLEQQLDRARPLTVGLSAFVDRVSAAEPNDRRRSPGRPLRRPLAARRARRRARAAARRSRRDHMDRRRRLGGGTGRHAALAHRPDRALQEPEERIRGHVLLVRRAARRRRALGLVPGLQLRLPVLRHKDGKLRARAVRRLPI